MLNSFIILYRKICTVPYSVSRAVQLMIRAENQSFVNYWPTFSY